MTGFVLSHSGRQHSYRVALALQHAKALDVFLTSMYYKRERFPDALLRALPPCDRWMRKRWQEGLDPGLVVRRPLMELPEIAARAAGVRAGRVRRLVERRDMRFDDWVAGRLPSLGSTAFWGFQGSCARSVQAARAAGKTTVVEMASIPTQVIRDLMTREGIATEERAIDEESARYRRRVDGEPLSADWCVAASGFCARALAAIGVRTDRIQVIPLGADVRKFAHGERTRSDKLRVLFVGKLGRHKGLRYLLGAMKRLRSSRVSLSLAGPSVGDEASLDFGDARMLGSVDDMARVYSEHDVLVLPSLYEGFGLVVLEAMASGIPVIATENTCAPDVITQGEEGFVVPAFDEESIAAHLDWMATHSDRVSEMGRKAALRAADFSWDRHAHRVAEFARRVVSFPR